jgi:hypothetical protein
MEKGCRDITLKQPLQMLKDRGDACCDKAITRAEVHCMLCPGPRPKALVGLEQGKARVIIKGQVQEPGLSPAVDEKPGHLYCVFKNKV